MQFKTFAEGFRYELANRGFARITMNRIAATVRGKKSEPFWSGYARLEEFNAPRYAEAAARMDITYSLSPSTRLRGELIGRTPRPLLPSLLRFAYPRTVEYAEDIKRIRAAGPNTEAEFLRYMDEQEELQVFMMNAALRANFSAAGDAAEKFLQRWS